MRHEYEKVLGEEIRYLAIKTREHLDLTQKEMEKRLLMSESLYSEIETGETDCTSALTVTLLLSMQKDSKNYMDHVIARVARQSAS